MQGKTILIIGASSGIGRATAQLAISKGATVLSASRTNPNLAGVEHFDLDITDTIADLSFMPSELHGLVYAPGTINLKPFHRFKEEDFQHDLNINVLGATRVLQAAFKSLKAAKGASVVLYSTVAAKLGMNFQSSIALAKGAVEGLGKSLAAEWGTHNIRVNMVAPSLTDTPLAGRILSTDDKKEASNKRHPIGRYGESEDLAEMTAFLLSDQSSWVTGQVIGVDGGVGNLKP